jgi:hypothetical protein
MIELQLTLRQTPDQYPVAEDRRRIDRQIVTNDYVLVLRGHALLLSWFHAAAQRRNVASLRELI